MELVADLHVHSRFSRATSGELDLEHLYLWAQRKGVQIVGSGDFTHPGWFAELEEKLTSAGEGLYRLRPELEAALDAEVPPACAGPVRFLLSTEISNIYKRGERTRKVHNLILLPSLEAASALARALSRIGNLASDGRPILGLDSRDLLELVLETSAGRGLLIPAHIWTPWFSALGSRSGFDSIAECYRDLEPEILAVETGLSSDPPMNHRLSSLDRYALVSSSDAHSPQKLGREATLFSCEPAYESIREALRTRRGLAGTLEFFPEEGKYHYDGHRACGVRLAPAESRARAGTCPVCGRPLTLGVMYRVEELADRPEGARPEHAAPFTSLCGLAEVLAEVQGVGASSASVLRARDLLCARLGPELAILRALPEEELRREAGPLFAEAIGRMRRGEVETEGGFDGEFGRVHLLRAEERGELAGQAALFARLPLPRRQRERSAAATAGHQPVARPPSAQGEPGRGASLDLFARLSAPPDPLAELDERQREAASHRGSPVLIVAGPGTGKTHTLTRRIARRVLAGVAPTRVLAVTFTVKAAAELRARLAALLGEERARAIRVSTFHALSLAILDDARARAGEPPLVVLGEAERDALLAEVFAEVEAGERARLGEALLAGDAPAALSGRWRAALAARGAIELDALCPAAVRALSAEAPLLARWRERSRTVCVDEYQDLNQAQYELVRLLCPADDPALDLCAIGDPDQAIYGFRGADPRFFLRFAEDYPTSVRFALERSHRSPRVVLEAAAALIAHNRERLPTRTVSDLPGAPRLSVLRAESAEAEAELVAARIERALGGVSLLSTEGREGEALSPAEVAVLFRTRAQADLLRRALERLGVPCRSSAGRRGTEELEPVLAFLRGVLAGEAATLADEGAELREHRELRRAAEALAPRAALELLCTTLCAPEALALARASASRLAALLYDQRGSGLASWAPGLLSLCATCAEPDALGGETVSLLTLHAAKGLEFASVTIVGCEEGLLPALRPRGERDGAASLEEERRLFYVGMTRARRELTLTWAARRGAGLRSPSRFLDELPATLLAREAPRARARRPQLTLFR